MAIGTALIVRFATKVIFSDPGVECNLLNPVAESALVPIAVKCTLRALGAFLKVPFTHEATALATDMMINVTPRGMNPGTSGTVQSETAL